MNPLTTFHADIKNILEHARRAARSVGNSSWFFPPKKLSTRCVEN